MSQFKFSLWFSVLMIVVCVISGSGFGQAAVPMLISYQGELRSPATGGPVRDDTYDMLFWIYDVEFGGTPLWEGTHSSANGNPVEVTDGVFEVVLGSGTGNTLDRSVFNGADRWLQIQVETETLDPRQRITSVAYSIVSENSRLLDGREATDFAEAAHSHSGSDIISGMVAEARIDPAVARDAEIAAHADIPDAHHGKTISFSELTDAATDAQIPDNITIDYAKKAGDADTLDGFDSTDLMGGGADYGRPGIASDLYEGSETLSDKYINSAGPDTISATSASPALSVENSGIGSALRCYSKSLDGIQSFSDGDTGYALYGMCSGSEGLGVYGVSSGDKGRGVWGLAEGQSGRGIMGRATDSYEHAINYGGHFETLGGEGRAVYGLASYATPGTDGENYGGYFEARGRLGCAVYGLATHEINGQNEGGHFESRGDHGVGVYAEGQSIGLRGVGAGTSSVGVHATGSEAAVLCEGDLVVTGQYKGNIGPNEGAPFPRPAYDSGWQPIDKGDTITLKHELGGDPDDYIVDLQFANVNLSFRNQEYYGGWPLRDPRFPDEEVYSEYGAYWRQLNDTQIDVHRGHFNPYAPYVRVRIWVCGSRENQ